MGDQNQFNCPFTFGIADEKARWHHTLQRDPNYIAKKALGWNLQGRRKRGRPKQTWRRTGWQNLEVIRLAQHRADWLVARRHHKSTKWKFKLIESFLKFRQKLKILIANVDCWTSYNKIVHKVWCKWHVSVREMNKKQTLKCICPTQSNLKNSMDYLAIANIFAIYCEVNVLLERPSGQRSLTFSLLT